MTYRRMMGWILITAMVVMAGGTGFIYGELRGYSVGAEDGAILGAKIGYQIGYIDGALGAPPMTTEEEIIL